MYDDELALFRIRTLRETKSLKPVTAIKGVADEMGLKGAVRKRFINRLRDKYPKHERAGTLPETEPIPPDLREALEKDYREADEGRKFIQELLKAFTAQAEAYGFDPSTDLRSTLEELQKEFNELRRLIGSGPEVTSLRLRTLEPRGREATEALYRRLRDRYREVEKFVVCLSGLLELQEAARHLDEGTPPRRS